MIGPVGGPGRINRHPPRPVTLWAQCLPCQGARTVECSVTAAEDGEVQQDCGVTVNCGECGTSRYVSGDELQHLMNKHIADYNLHS